MNLYDAVGASDRYDAARSLPQSSMDHWLEEFKEALPVPPSIRILDLGCGTGRFAEELQRTFSCPVVGVDPAEAMLETARSKQTTGVEWLHGSAESIPLADASADLVFMSQAYHHIKDSAQAFREIRRVLTAGGFLMIRNGTQECMQGAPWLQCFPTAGELDRVRMPSRAGLISLALQNKFELISQKMVVQLFANSYEEYVEKIGSRGLSALIAISDEDFEEGMDNLRRFAREQPLDAEVHEKIDLFLFQATT